MGVRGLGEQIFERWRRVVGKSMQDQERRGQGWEQKVVEVHVKCEHFLDSRG